MESMLYQGHTFFFFWWHKAFLDGRERVEDKPRTGRPCTSKTDENMTKVRAVVRSDRRLTVRMIGTIVRSLATQKKGSSCPARDCRHLDAASRQRSLSHCHLCEGIFDQKGYSNGSAAPYSPNLSPCDLFLFPKLKIHLKGRNFGTVDNIQMVVTDQPRALPHEFCQHCYREWEQRLQRYVASHGNYFERDNVDF